MRCILPALLVGVSLQQAAATDRPPTVECPTTITVDQIARDVPFSWQAATDSESHRYRLQTAALFSGPPPGRGELRPTSVSGDARKGGEKFVYEFEGKYSNGVFIACRYAFTSVIIFRKVLPTPRTCSFERRMAGHGLAPIRVDCR
jgi:hypothetical protein